GGSRGRVAAERHHVCGAAAGLQQLASLGRQRPCRRRAAVPRGDADPGAARLAGTTHPTRGRTHRELAKSRDRTPGRCQLNRHRMTSLVGALALLLGCAPLTLVFSGLVEWLAPTTVAVAGVVGVSIAVRSWRPYAVLQVAG